MVYERVQVFNLQAHRHVLARDYIVPHTTYRIIMYLDGNQSG